MPAEFDWEPHGIVVRLSGVVTGDELLHLIPLVRSNSRFAKARYAIFHCSSAEAFDVDRDAFRAIAQALGNIDRENPGSAFAAVARGRRALAFARKCLDLRIHPMPAEMFTNFDDARRWISERTGVPCGARLEQLGPGDPGP